MSKAGESLTGTDAVEMQLMQQLRRAIPEASWQELASLLQLEIQPKPYPQESESQSGLESDNSSMAITPPADAERAGQSAIAYPPASKELPFLYLHGMAQQAPVTADEHYPRWYNETETVQEIRSEMGEEIEPEPLISWGQFWPVLHVLFRDYNKTSRIDTQRIIGQAVKQQPLTTIPWQQKLRWPSELVVLIDFSPHLTPYFKDFTELGKQLKRWFKQRLKLVVCLDAERQIYLYKNSSYSGFPCINEGVEILYLGDLGFLDQQRISMGQWQLLGAELARRNARIEAILVADPSDWEQELGLHFHLHHWNGERLISTAASRNARHARGAISEQQTEQLLAYLSLAFELTPALVRVARQKLGFAVSVESLLFQHAALEGNATCFQWRTKTIRSDYRKQFDEQQFNREEAWQLIKRFEVRLPMELQIEQRQQLGEPLSSAQKRFILCLVKSQQTRALSQESSEMLLGWIGRMAQRSADGRWQNEFAALYALYWNENRDKKACIVPKGIDLTRLPRWIVGENRQQPVCLTQGQNELTLSEVEEASQKGEVASFQLSTRSEVVLHGRNGDEKQALYNNSRIVLPDHAQRITIKTREQQLTLNTMSCPSWATGIGRDRYGLFVEVEVKSVPFTLRWIPPGRFMLGSPEEEPERLSTEGPQQRITFEEGYWLAETACTQALWQAVMRKNPSSFKGEQNPVENVDWGDVKKFINVLNKLEGAFDFRLPSEAEWECACRAGTTTPFWFGNELTTDEANYDGNYPYNSGKKGEYRKQTLPVKTFQRNPWGLYQMHGNVWEWCEDYWHNNHQGADPNGGARPQRESKDHVCRGGSWLSHGGSLRSACRSGWHVGSGYYGFRLARGSESSSSAGAKPALGQRSEGRVEPPQGRLGGSQQDED